MRFATHPPALVALVVVLLSFAQATRSDELRGRVIDARTGRPLACRVYLQSTDGEWFFVRSRSPQGSAVEYRKQRSPTSLEMHTTVSAHPFVADVPPGAYRVRVERGKEYFSVEKTVTVGKNAAAGKTEVEIELTRWIDMAAAGWYSGDTHVHRSLDDLPNLLLAEDLNVGLPLTYWVTVSDTSPASGNKTDDAAAKVPAQLIRVDATHVIYPVNTEYEIFRVGQKRHTLGAVFVLNHRRPLELGVPPVRPVAEEARRQGALLDLDKHSWPWSLMIVPVMDVDLFELANNHVWRTQFAFKDWTIEMAADYMNLQRDDRGFTEWGWLDFGFQTYYALLNCGFRMRPTAGTASGVHPVPLGFGRVYVHLPDGFSYDGWMDGLKAGRSFVTTGPMLDLHVDGRQGGATIVREASQSGPFSLTVAGKVTSAEPLKPIEILVNGQVVQRLPAANRRTSAGAQECSFSTEVEIDGSSWITARVFEDREDGRIRFAHGSPVHVDVAGRPLRPRRQEVEYLVTRMKEELDRNRDVLSEEALDEYRQAMEIFRERGKDAR